MPLTQHRTGQNFPLFLGLFFLVWTLRATVGFHVDTVLPAGGGQQLYALVSKVLLWLVPAILFAVAIRGDRPAESLRLGWPDFSRQAWLPAIIGIVVLASVAWDATRQHTATFADLGAVLLENGFAAALWALPVAGIEGVVFRGLILTELSERLRFGAANLVAALLFVAIHWPHWLWMHGFTASVWYDSFGVLIVGLVTGILTRYTRSIWPGTLWHVVFICITRVW